MPTQLKQLIRCAFLFVLLCLPTQAMAGTFDCQADASWFPSATNTPTMPTEVPNTGSNNPFCGFYQFSWQAFLYLMSPASTGTERNFEVQANYPVLEFDSSGKPLNSCDDTITGNTHRISLAKSENLPEDIHQAGDSATIYDQNRNVVYYEVKFDRNTCNVAPIQKMNNFPPGTTELKFAWKVLTPAEIASKTFVAITASIGSQSNVTLGLVGMHVAVATQDHPEFVWATFEHATNDPNCTGALGVNSWSFTSGACNTALVSKDQPKIVACKFNQAKEETSITGTPTEICRVYPYGTATGDLKATENVEDITSLNANVLAMLPNADPSMAVLKNYFNVGAIWVSDINQGSTVGNQRGSLRLANTTAETTFQHVDLNPNTNKGFASNCFGCHNYVAPGNNTTSGNLSHIFNDIVAGQCKDVQAGPIWNNIDAKNKCPKTCQNSSPDLTWNGQWTTTQPGIMSVCGCCP